MWAGRRHSPPSADPSPSGSTDIDGAVVTLFITEDQVTYCETHNTRGRWGLSRAVRSSLVGHRRPRWRTLSEHRAKTWALQGGTPGTTR